jgi:LysM repeat protein
MKEQITYHIDTTQEEDNLFRDITSELVQPKTLKKGTFTKIFCGVFVIHILGAGLITLLASPSKVNAPEELNKSLDQAPVAQSSPTPEPTPIPQIDQQLNNPTSTKNPITKKDESKKSAIIKNYTVKQGDTISSIAKKYKLSTKRLLEINKIKDTNKINVGQVLKFM